MEDLGASPKSVNNIIHQKKWVDIYKLNLDYHYNHLDEKKFSENRFKEDIFPELTRAFNDIDSNLLETRIRDTIQKWSWLSENKIHFLLRLRRLIPEEIAGLDYIREFYSDIPKGTVEDRIFNSMTPDVRKKWADGNKVILYKSHSVNNLLGVLLSEQFFTLEPMFRVIGMGNCLIFAVKSISPDVTVQHNEIYNTLKMLGSKEKQRESCKICPLKEKCKNLDAFLDLSSIYSLFYHFRIIKDYKLELFYNNEFQGFLISDYLPKSYDIIVKVERIMNRVLSKYLLPPILMDSWGEEIRRIIETNFKDLE
jgi:hypothetical protein